MGPLDKQMAVLADRFAGAAHHSMPSGAGLVTVPGVRLPEGWSKPETSVRFVVSPGYPFAALDCFWADADLRLANGQVPQNANIMAVGELAEQGLWFSWHLAHGWDPNRDTLSSWMNTVTDRFRKPQ